MQQSGMNNIPFTVNSTSLNNLRYSNINIEALYWKKKYPFKISNDGYWNPSLVIHQRNQVMVILQISITAKRKVKELDNKSMVFMHVQYYIKRFIYIFSE